MTVVEDAVPLSLTVTPDEASPLTVPEIEYVEEGVGVFVSDPPPPQLETMNIKIKETNAEKI